MTRNVLVTCNQLGHSVIAVDADDYTEIARIPTLPEPHMVVFDERRRQLYVAITYRDGFYDVHGDRGTEITVIDVDSWQVTGVLDISPYAGPHDMFIDPVRDLLHIACESHGGCVALVDLGKRSLVTHIETNTAGPHWITALPDNSKAYTGNKEATFVSVLDLEHRRMVGKIPMPNGSEDLEVSADGRFLFANDRDRPLLHIIDTETDTEIDAVELPENPHRIHLTTTGLAVISHFRMEKWRFDQSTPGSVSVIDAATRAQVAHVEVGPGPLGISSDPEGSRIFVDNASDATMSVINTATWQVDRTVPLDRGAHDVVYLRLTD